MAKKKNIELVLPIHFIPINLGNPFSEDRARDAIQKYNEEIVLLKDTHKGPQYTLGKIKINKNDSECYTFQNILSESPQTLHYHDLEGLMTSPLQGANAEIVIKKEQ